MIGGAEHKMYSRIKVEERKLDRGTNSQNPGPTACHNRHVSQKE